MEPRIPPHNSEAERAVIGSILIDNDLLDEIIELILPQSFYEPRHELIMEAIIELYREKRAVDILTLTDVLKKRKKFRESGGASYLSELVGSVPTSSHGRHYAGIVREMAVRRRLISLGSKLDEQARQNKDTLDTILEDTEKELLALSKDNISQDFYDSTTLLDIQMKRADEYAKNPDGIRGLATGMKSVDKILQGLHNSDMIILAARPSVGKSAMAINIARHVAVEENKTVAFFSLEMPAVQIIERMLAQQMKANLWNIRMGKLTKDEMQRYPEGFGRLADAKIFIDDTPGITSMQLRSKARKLTIEKGLDLIVVDYLQLMQTRDIDNRAQAVGEISRSLKILARELNIPIIALSQLNRAVETRGRSDKTPQLSDLRESGSIEQDADVVVFLSRERDLDEEEDVPEEIKVELTVAKHRNGPIGRAKLLFNGPRQRFEDI